MEFRRLAYALLIVAMAAVVPAQNGGPGGSGQGAQNQHRLGLSRLLCHEAVRAELRLNAQQRRQIQTQLHGTNGECPGVGNGGVCPNPGRTKSGADINGALKRILDQSQLRRWQEIELQAAGPQAFSRSAVASQLKLNTQQRNRIRQVLKDNLPDCTASCTCDPATCPGQNVQRRERAMQQIMASLTQQQQVRYRHMLGAPFQLPPPPMVP
ncbi:MAG: hypothetical protein SNJ76_11140 [Fimbriimonadaceae bacterium]